MIGVKKIVMTLGLTLVALVSCQEQQVGKPLHLSADNAQTILVPEGNGTPVLIDGRFSPGEWDDATRVNMAAGIDLCFKQYRGHVFIGVDCPQLKMPFGDLYISTDGTTLHQFHVSGNVSERVLTDTNWTKATPAHTWGEAIGWTANEFRIDQARAKELIGTQGMKRDEAFGAAMYDYDGLEFQFAPTKFSAGEWLIRVEMSSASNPQEPFVFPLDSKQKTTEGWSTLQIK